MVDDFRVGMPPEMRNALSRSPDFERMGQENAERSAMMKGATDSLLDMQRRKNNPVLDIFDDVVSLVQAFQSGLDEEHEVGIYVMGSVSAVHIRSIEYRTPSLLVFHGVDSGARTTLAVQYIAQLNLQLVAAPKIEEKPYRIGFIQSPE